MSLRTMPKGLGKKLSSHKHGIIKILWVVVLVAVGVLPVLVKLLPAGWVNWLPSFAKDSLDWWREFVLWGFWAAILAGVMIAWAAYVFQTLRVRIRRFFQPQLTYVRAPMMVGVAPLIIAKTKGIWDNHGLNLDLDFRYAGAKALEDLRDAQYTLAVASDVAICSFIQQNPELELSVMPFVRITDHLKILVRADDGPRDLAGLRELLDKQNDARIAFYKDSVHEHFLRVLELLPLAGGSSKRMSEAGSALECYRMLCVDKQAPKKVLACILWEPHYHAFTDFGNVRVLNNTKGDDYTWFLCLVATKKHNHEHPEVANSILLAMRQAAKHCAENFADVVKECAAFVLTEFTGIDAKGLKSLFESQPHSFCIDDNIKPFYARLSGLRKDLAIGYAVGRLEQEQCLWPGLKWPGIEKPGSSKTVDGSSGSSGSITDS